jgi:F0F1-type ATP synthase assembly protein I
MQLLWFLFVYVIVFALHKFNFAKKNELLIPLTLLGFAAIILIVYRRYQAKLMLQEASESGGDACRHTMS